MTDNNGTLYDKICRFCGFEKNLGKFIFSSEAVKIGLLSKIKQLFPEEAELINTEAILPKFICNSCETTINYFFEFYNTVKLVQENFKKRIQPEKVDHEHCPNILYTRRQHSCHEKQTLITISFDSKGIIKCNSCCKKLNQDEIRDLKERPSYCICNECGYKDETYLFLHKKRSNLTCPRCSFAQKNNMTHVRESSTQNERKKKEFKCDVCGKIFRSKGHLNRHCVTHFGAKPYLCENCGTGFNQRSTLKTHTLIHKKVNPFSCKWCGQQFRHKQTLLNHVMSIHGFVSEVGSVYECDKCKKKFVNKAKLRRHYRSHSGEKPFKCGICEKTFTQNVNLKTHYKKHEVEENQFASMSMYSSEENVLNEAEQGKLIRELFTDCQQLNLNLDTISPQHDNNDDDNDDNRHHHHHHSHSHHNHEGVLNSRIQKDFNGQQDMNLKPATINIVTTTPLTTTSTTITNVANTQMYYNNISSSYDLIYADNTDCDLYDANRTDVIKITSSSLSPSSSSSSSSSILPTFSTLNTVP